MAKFDVTSLFGVNIDFAYFDVFELLELLGISRRILKTERVANLIKKHGEKHHIVSVTIRQVLLSELKATLNKELLPFHSPFQDVHITSTDYERRYEAEEKLILLCYSISLSKSVTSIRRLKGEEFSKNPREFHSKGKSLYDYFRSLLNDNTREYVLAYKEGRVDPNGLLTSASESEKGKVEVNSEPLHAETDQQRAISRKDHAATVPFHKEVERATSLMINGVQLLHEEVKQSLAGVPLNVLRLSSFCKKLIESYDRNPHSLLAARHIQNSEDYM